MTPTTTRRQHHHLRRWRWRYSQVTTHDPSCTVLHRSSQKPNHTSTHQKANKTTTSKDSCRHIIIGYPPRRDGRACSPSTDHLPGWIRQHPRSITPRWCRERHAEQWTPGVPGSGEIPPDVYSFIHRMATRRWFPRSHQCTPRDKGARATCKGGRTRENNTHAYGDGEHVDGVVHLCRQQPTERARCALERWRCWPVLLCTFNFQSRIPARNRAATNTGTQYNTTHHVKVPLYTWT